MDLLPGGVDHCFFVPLFIAEAMVPCQRTKRLQSKMEVNLRTPYEVRDDSKEGETLKPKCPLLGFKKMAMKFPTFGDPVVVEAFAKRGRRNSTKNIP